jgi:hypothetical protein
VAEELGAPFMPDIITTFLPDGFSFEEVEYPDVDYNPVSYAFYCSFQAGEVMRIFTGYHKPVLAPEAYVIDIKAQNYLKKVELKLKTDQND